VIDIDVSGCLDGIKKPLGDDSRQISNESRKKNMGTYCGTKRKKKTAGVRLKPEVSNRAKRYGASTIRTGGRGGMAERPPQNQKKLNPKSPGGERTQSIKSKRGKDGMWQGAAFQVSSLQLLEGRKTDRRKCPRGNNVSGSSMASKIVMLNDSQRGKQGKNKK